MIVRRPKNSYSQEEIFSLKRDLRRLRVSFVCVLFFCIVVIISLCSAVCHLLPQHFYMDELNSPNVLYIWLNCVYFHYSCRGLISSCSHRLHFICRSAYNFYILAYISLVERTESWMHNKTTHIHTTSSPTNFFCFNEIVATMYNNSWIYSDAYTQTCVAF